MKPYERYGNVKFFAKRDVHPPKGWMNWWEDRTFKSKSAVRQIVKNDLARETININGHILTQEDLANDDVDRFWCEYYEDEIAEWSSGSSAGS